ncbi:MAG: ParB/RepB/Spo0J family partition protein [Planctomycetes bacterium]|nr:ParB/RepB/Spo0J family partition protein [Planctomycetota bacterium]
MRVLRRLCRSFLQRPRRTGVVEIPIEKICVLRTPPRRGFRPERFAALERSVRRHGILSPLIVRPAREGFEVIAGHLRLAAARRAGLRHVPAVIRDVDDGEAEAIRLAENAVREPLSEMDALESMERVLLAGPAGDPRAAIEAEGLDPSFFLENRDLLALPEPVKQALALGLVDARQVRSSRSGGTR